MFDHVCIEIGVMGLWDTVGGTLYISFFFFWDIPEDILERTAFFPWAYSAQWRLSAPYIIFSRIISSSSYFAHCLLSHTCDNISKALRT